MSRTKSEPGFHPLVVPKPLWDLLIACEVHCTARCCEDMAFDQDPVLIRKAVDKLQSGDGSKNIFKRAKLQLNRIISELDNLEMETEFDQLLVWAYSRTGSFEFQLNADIAPDWFRKWREVFERSAVEQT